MGAAPSEASEVARCCLQALGAPQSGDASARLNRWLESELKVCRERWPGISVEPAKLGERIAIGLGKASRLDEHAFGELFLTDLFLAAACSPPAAPAALSAFDVHVLSAVRKALVSINPSQAFAHDVAQLVRARLLLTRGGEPPRIDGYTGRSPLRAWLKAIALRVGLNAARPGFEVSASQLDAARLGDRVAERDPEVRYLERRYQPAFKAAFAAAVGQLEPKTRTVLRLYYVDGLKMDQIAPLYGVNKSTVSRWVAEAQKSLVELTRDGVRQRLRLGKGELTSMMRALKSNLEVSLERLLRSDA